VSGTAAADELWARHGEEWRDPAQIASQWREASDTDPALLRGSARGRFWEILAERGLTLIVTREYEHLIMALSFAGRRPRTSFMRMPHPSGLAVDASRGVVHVASTRNPNQLYELEPVTGDPRTGAEASGGLRPLIPIRSRFLPGSLYLHDLALLGGRLYGNAVGHNAVVALGEPWRHAWWPRSIERPEGPDFSRNYLQLNSIAAGTTLARSFFSASAATISARRPGQRNFPVDGRGVIFSGRTREPVVSGLTRPHSARLHGGRLWVANSGYGELCVIDDGRASVVARLPGWTRGLWLGEGIALVGTSRVIPRFRSYAPGLAVEQSLCGVHAVELASGVVLGSLRWPDGNQIFAIDALPAGMSEGFPFTVGRRGAAAPAATRAIFYRFSTRGGAKASHG
jgi:uncharacterized protein (TIGR03032 family)